MLKKATVGALVLFYSRAVADRNPRQLGYGYNGCGEGPYPAIITQVWEDGLGEVNYCNLKVFPHGAPPFDEGSVAEFQARHYHPGRCWVWPDAGTPDIDAPKDSPAAYIPTTIELSWGAAGVVEPSEKRTFEAWLGNDALVRFSERVLELDSNPAVSGGWVHLKQFNPDRHIAGWTKTSNERPTAEGVKPA